MVAGLTHFIKTIFIYKVYHDLLLLGFPDNGPNRAVCQTVLNKKPINGSAGAEGFQHDISALDNRIVISHINFPFLRPVSTRERILSSSPFR